MDKRLYDVLNGKEDNYLAPLWWQYGEQTHLLPSEIQRIYDSGCRAFCVESRPHPDFLGETWWRDMDIILEEAAKRDMKVWLFDDDHFPTGHAAGLIGTKYPELRAWELIERHIDVVGSAPDTSILVGDDNAENILIAAYAYKRRADEFESCIEDTAVELTDKIHGNFLTWDIPEGVWRIFFYYKSRQGAKYDYIDMINPESVKVLIDSVYEGHFARYSKYFGNTFAGFFTDEPEFGNQVFGKERFDFGFYEARVGKHSLSLPWNENLLGKMTEKLGYSPIKYLNLLWYEDGENGDVQAEIRHAYMDSVTELYSKCFNKQIADWCHAHGVEYIGHVIEDMNCHLRGGVGHYFRAVRWQDMSGIDIVLHQIMPGMADYLHTVTCATGVGAGSFYEYILAKLGASLAHLNPAMKGRAMCEVFGAYGWGEDSSMMKFLIDHLLVRGINFFIPHSFSPKFPDYDCPPHIGAQGYDPSLEAETALLNYANKAAHILSDTTHKANAAILYHVHGEWASRYNEASNMEPVATRLYDNHIDFDIVDMDVLREGASVKNNKLCINKESFDCLIVPYADHMPEVLLTILKNLQDAGLPVYFMRSMPENAAFSGEVLDESELVPKMKEMGMTDVIVEDGYPKLRIYHCTRDGKDIFMFANEDYNKTVDTVLTLPCSGEYARLDILTDIYTSGVAVDGKLALKLSPNQSQIVIFGDRAGFDDEISFGSAEKLSPSYELSLAECDDLKDYKPCGRFDKLFNINSPDFRPDFSGKMKYTFNFECKKSSGKVFIDLGRVGQNAQLSVNGKDCGIRISAPYLFDITDAVSSGENEAVVIVSNTLAQRERDGLSYFLQLAPSGLLGDIYLKYANK